MRTLTWILAAGVFSASAATAGAEPAGQPRLKKKCQYVIQRAGLEAAAPGLSRALASPHDAKMISAVDRKLDGCPVLVLASTGEMVAPPEMTTSPARRSPAQ